MSADFIQKYSYALLEVADERNDTEILGQLRSIREDLKEEELGLLLAHPQIDKEIKKESLKKIFSISIPEYILNFLYVLIDNKRIQYFDQIVDSFEDLWYERENIERITIVSAIDLSQEKLEDIARAYKGSSGKKIEVTGQVDPAIIGGIILKVDNKIIDRSIQGQLGQMEKDLQQRT